MQARAQVLVTGGAGYVGSHCVQALIEAGYRVVVLDDLSGGQREAVPSEAELVVADVRDGEALDALFAAQTIDAVLHFAANSLVGESMEQPLRYVGDNVEGALSLLRAMERHSVVKLVLSSTASVFGSPERMPIDEDTPLRPSNPYGESKLMIERMLQWQGRAKGLRWAALRYFNAAGADPSGVRGEAHDPETHLIPIVLDVALGRREHIAIFGDDYPTPDGSCVRDYVHVCDLAEAHIGALTALDRDASLALNLGTGKGSSVREVIEVAREVTGHAIPLRIAPRREGDPPVLVASYRRAEQLIGWRPRHDLRSMIETAWRWHSRQQQS